MPSLGDKTYCKDCGGAAHWTGQYWIHTNAMPRHPVIPTLDAPTMRMPHALPDDKPGTTFTETLEKARLAADLLNGSAATCWANEDVLRAARTFLTNFLGGQCETAAPTQQS